LGLLFITSFFASNEPITQFTIYYSFFLFVLASTLISDFTSVLIDVRDNFIILPKPVSDRTFLFSRLLHILIHVSKLVLPLNLPVMVVLVIQKGWLALVPFLILLPFATIFAIFLINGIYLLILRITTPEKFKTIINYFQIVFAILIYGGYQIIPRIMDLSVLENYQMPENGWSLLAPSYWFACAWQLLYQFHVNHYQLLAAALGIFMPLFALWLIIRYFAPSFNQKLGMIAGGENSSDALATIKKDSSKPGYAEQWSHIITRKGAERMGFRFTWLMTGRSRDFKMKTYPGIGYLLVMIALVIIRSKSFSFSSIRENETSARIVLLSSVYIIGMLVLQALYNIKLSDKHKASWIYHIAPLEQPGPVILGATKALILKFFLPFALLLLSATLVFMGWGSLPNLLLGLANQVCIIFTVSYLSFNRLPFSSSDMGKLRGGNFARNVVSMIFPWLLGAGHFFIYNFLPVVFILLGLACIAIWLLTDALRQRTWSSIKLEE
jgi:hypothetical protein